MIILIVCSFIFPCSWRCEINIHDTRRTNTANISLKIWRHCHCFFNLSWWSINGKIYSSRERRTWQLLCGVGVTCRWNDRDEMIESHSIFNGSNGSLQTKTPKIKPFTTRVNWRTGRVLSYLHPSKYIETVPLSGRVDHVIWLQVIERGTTPPWTVNEQTLTDLKTSRQINFTRTCCAFRAKLHDSYRAHQV